MKSFIIADSGSTKTEWVIYSNNEIDSCTTMGYNPFFMSTQDIIQSLKNELLLKNIETAEAIYFYGAGCSSTERKNIVATALQVIFSDKKIEVEHDLLAAARSLCGRNAGIAAILGTGSNSCLYDGKNILENIPALGYVLGDEGSGAYLGKKLMTAFLYNELPLELNQELIDKFKLDKEKIFYHVYSKPLPNKFLASFGKFLSDHSDSEYVKDFVEKSFNSFFVHHISKYTEYNNYSFNCTGSIGFNFKNILEKVAESFNIKPEKITKSPMEGLIKFHLEEM